MQTALRNVVFFSFNSNANCGVAAIPHTSHLLMDDIHNSSVSHLVVATPIVGSNKDIIFLYLLFKTIFYRNINSRCSATLPIGNFFDDRTTHTVNKISTSCTLFYKKNDRIHKLYIAYFHYNDNKQKKTTQILKKSPLESSLTYIYFSSYLNRNYILIHKLEKISNKIILDMRD